MAEDELLLRVLSEVQRRGGIGPVALATAVQHARQYVVACPPGPGRLVDLGSGGGLPGLVIAVDRDDLETHLVERRAKRADLLRYAVRALDLDDRVTVHESDVNGLIEADELGSVDVVTARSFAPLPDTLRLARRLLRPQGVAIISIAPQRGQGSPVAEAGSEGMVAEADFPGVRRFRAAD